MRIECQNVILVSDQMDTFIFIPLLDTCLVNSRIYIGLCLQDSIHTPIIDGGLSSKGFS